MRCRVFRAALIAWLATVTAACSTPLLVGPSGGPDAGVDTPDAAADADVQQPLTLTRRIPLTPFSDQAEDLLVDSSQIVIAAIARQYVFDLDGNLLSAPSDGTARAPATGIDGSGDRWAVNVYGHVMSWYGWELQVDPLDGVGSATGVAVDVDASGTAQRVFVTDATVSSLREHDLGGAYISDLALPGNDLQGAAFAPDHTLYVLDASRRRILRIDADRSRTEGAGVLPAGPEIPSGIHFDAAGSLYVSYRNVARVDVFTVSIPPSS